MHWKKSFWWGTPYAGASRRAASLSYQMQCTAVERWSIKWTNVISQLQNQGEAKADWKIAFEMGLDEVNEIRVSMKPLIKSRTTGLKGTNWERQKALRWAGTLWSQHTSAAPPAPPLPLHSIRKPNGAEAQKPHTPLGYSRFLVLNKLDGSYNHSYSGNQLHKPFIHTAKYILSMA